MKQKNHPVLKVVWVLGQGAFLPMILWLNDARVFGNYGQAIGLFALLELLYIADALLFLILFRKEV